MHLGEGLGVIGDVCVHAAKNTKVVGMLSEAGEDFGNPLTGLAVLLEVEGRGFEAGSSSPPLAVVLCKVWLVVESIYMGGRPFHAEENDPLRFGGKVGGLGIQ